MEAILAKERERRIIAHDLHDDLGQLLHVAMLKVGALARTEPKGSVNALVRELLINVAKHAGVREAWVNISTDGETLVLLGQWHEGLQWGTV